MIPKDGKIWFFPQWSSTSPLENASYGHQKSSNPYITRSSSWTHKPSISSGSQRHRQSPRSHRSCKVLVLWLSQSSWHHPKTAALLEFLRWQLLFSNGKLLTSPSYCIYIKQRMVNSGDQGAGTQLSTQHPDAFPPSGTRLIDDAPLIHPGKHLSNPNCCNSRCWQRFWDPM